MHPSFAAPPEKTSAPASLYLHRRHVTFWVIRERERLGERSSRARGEGGGRSKRKDVFNANTRVCFATMFSTATYKHTHAHTHAHTHIHTHACNNACIYIFMYTYIYIHIERARAREKDTEKERAREREGEREREKKKKKRERETLNWDII